MAAIKKSNKYGVKVSFAKRTNKAESIGATRKIKKTLKGSRRPNERLLNSQINSRENTTNQQPIPKPKNVNSVT